MTVIDDKYSTEEIQALLKLGFSYHYDNQSKTSSFIRGEGANYIAVWSMIPYNSGYKILYYIRMEYDHDVTFVQNISRVDTFDEVIDILKGIIK